MTTAATNADAWHSSFTTTNTEDLITSSCLLYSDLSTWDLRDMSFDNTGDKAGYYYDNNVFNELYFNPCRQLNFDLTYDTALDANVNVNKYADLSSFVEKVDHASFGVYYDSVADSYTPLNIADQWLADESNALYAMIDGVEQTQEDAVGISVIYKSAAVCMNGEVESVMSLKFNVNCNLAEDAEPEKNEDGTNKFVSAVVNNSDLTGCEKEISFDHHTGCYQYSALGFVNFLNSNVWLSGTLLLVFGLTIGLFGQRWFLKITGAVAGLFAFVAFMILASIFQWLNTTVGLIICGIFAIAAGVLAYWFLSREGVATMFLCIGGGFMLGSIIEGLIIAISGWESMIFYIIVTAACMVIGGLIGCQKPDLVKKYLTSCVGSYIFMRGWTYFLGGYPSEMEMYSMMANPDSADLDFNGLFWFYVALFVGGVFAFVYIQTTWSHAQAEKDNEYEKK
jgi:hypothetical protein